MEPWELVRRCVPWLSDRRFSFACRSFGISRSRVYVSGMCLGRDRLMTAKLNLDRRDRNQFAARYISEIFLMKYVNGFMVAVPVENKKAHIAMVTKTTPPFEELGVLRVVGCRADDVPDGKLTDLRMAVKAQNHEEVVLNRIEHPFKEVRDAVNQKTMSNPRTKELGESMPLDDERMVYGGLASVMKE